MIWCIWIQYIKYNRNDDVYKRHTHNTHSLRELVEANSDRKKQHQQQEQLQTPNHTKMRSIIVQSALLVLLAASSTSTAAFQLTPGSKPWSTMTTRSSCKASGSATVSALSSTTCDNDDDDGTNPNSNAPSSTQRSRRDVFKWASMAAAGAAGILTGSSGGLVQPPVANAASKTKVEEKQLNLSNEDIMKIVENDIVKGQFMVSGDLTRSIYDEKATFQDEIDTYKLDDWIIGVKRLFVAKNSHIDIIPDTFKYNQDKNTIELKFDEYLQFNLPLVKPTLSLTGTLILTRNPSTGLIVKYREIWDQDINTVLKTAKF